MKSFVFVVLMVLVLAAPAFGEVATTRPYPAVTLTQEVRANPPMRLHVATVDLTNPAVHLKLVRGGADPDGAGPCETTLLPTSEIAERAHLVIAVNGNFFAPKGARLIFGREVPYFIGNGARACGLTMDDGRLWSANPICRNWPSLIVAADGKVRIGWLDHIPRSARQIVSGRRQIVTAGRNTGDEIRPAPITAVGIDAAGKTLTFFVVDGRREDYSVGMTPKQAADELIRLGCADALQLDGGGSSTMVLRDPSSGDYRLLNTPSDGHDLIIPLSIERSVANAFGVTIDGIGEKNVATDEKSDAHR